jgi:8-oxo-dGTP pyrophosphatase MutT (NUDIX family)
LPTFFKALKRHLYWAIARTCFLLYRWFPVFGPLRASIGIIRRGQQFLVIERNDGRGLSFPGGIAGWRESDESAVRREILEETGFSVTSCELKMRYRSDADIPCDVSVFTADASGELKDSWEGSPAWMTLVELRPTLLKSQNPALEVLTRLRPEGAQDKV